MIADYQRKGIIMKKKILAVVLGLTLCLGMTGCASWDRAKATEITATDLTLDFVLDEKAREFYFEAQRRTDLIRYNKFTSNYTWDWKGETAGGTSISSHFSLLPIPSTQLVANSNLKQNPGWNQ